jgi:hypothetical protein
MSRSPAAAARAALEESSGWREPAGRAARGKAARRSVPREAHAQFAPQPDRADPVGLLERQAETRLPELLPIRYQRMLGSPLAYLRGAALAMAADLDGTPSTGLVVQACCDAHLGNFGIFASPERRLLFDINDFDETLPAPWEWDVKRLAASLEIAGRCSGFGQKQRSRLVRESAGQYRLELRRLAGQGNLDVWYTRGELDELAQRYRVILSRQERELAGTDLAAAGEELHDLPAISRIVAGSPRFIAAPPLVVPLAELPAGHDGSLGAQLDQLLTGYRGTLESDRSFLISQFRVADMARKVSGIGSVGLRCWIILLVGRDPADQLFLQVKEAQPSVLSQFAGASPVQNQGQRVVAGQRLMQASSDLFLGWHRVPAPAPAKPGRADEAAGLESPAADYYVRQLRDWKFSIATARMAPETMRSYGALCGRTLARAHARSGDRIAIGAYLGGSAAFETAIGEFAAVYADQNDRDYARFRAAVAAGRLHAGTGRNTGGTRRNTGGTRRNTGGTRRNTGGTGRKTGGTGR